MLCNAVCCHRNSAQFPQLLRQCVYLQICALLSRRDRLRLATYDPFKPEAWVGLEPLPPNTRAPDGSYPPLLQTWAIKSAI